MIRRPRLLLVALAIAALLWLLFAAAERALALAQRFLALPTWLQWTLGGILLAFAVAGLSCSPPEPPGYPRTHRVHGPAHATVAEW